MRTQATIRLVSLLMVLGMVGISCIKEPSASFTADKTTVNEGESVQFTDQSGNDPSIWTWTFEGGTPASSQSRDPVVAYNSEGVYSVTLEARNRRGADIMTRDNYITVVSPNTDLTFLNNTHTPVYIEVDNIFKTIPSGESVTYFDLEGNSAAYYAETSGKSASGSQIGLKLVWDYSVNLEGGDQEQNLNIGTDYFFLYITNNGTRRLTPIAVDHGDTEPLVESIALPADGIKYRIGYYYAWESTHIRAYYEDQPDSYTYWTHNEHFTFPNEKNQSVNVTNQFKKGTDSDPQTITTDSVSSLPEKRASASDPLMSR